jgi:hypothetical protein
MGKTLRALTLASSLVIIGCSGDVAYHDSDYEDRHVEHPRYVEERVYHETPAPRPLPPDEPTNVRASVDSGRYRDDHPVREDAPPPDQQVSADYDSGDTHVDVDAASEVPDAQDATYFQNDLQPYGNWVVSAQFGDCFRPSGVAVDWRPYSYGHWVYTDQGWLWASDEPFGWATYHYGRWYQDPSYGWIWVPGRTWAPAWVAWRHGGGCAGWAPLPPTPIGGTAVSINIQIGHIHPDQYCFVDERYIDAPRVHDHFRPVQQNVTIINQTTNITNITTVNNTVVNKGVSVTEVEQATGHKVKKAAVVQTSNKGPAKASGDTVAVYKKDLPPKKKKPVVTAVDTQNGNHNPSQTLATPDTPSKNKKPVVTDPKKNVDVNNDVNPKKKPAGSDLQTLGTDDNNSTGNKNKKKVDTDADHGKPDTTHDKKVKTDDAGPDVSGNKNKKKVDTDSDGDNGKSNQHGKSDDAPKTKTDDRSHYQPQSDDPKGKKTDTNTHDSGKGKGSDNSDTNGKKKDKNDNSDSDATH